MSDLALIHTEITNLAPTRFRVTLHYGDKSTPEDSTESICLTVECETEDGIPYLSEVQGAALTRARHVLDAENLRLRNIGRPSA